MTVQISEADYAYLQWAKGLSQAQRKIYFEIAEERNYQGRKWGPQSKHPLEWNGIIVEELGESVAGLFAGNMEEGRDSYRSELIQVAASAVAALENYDGLKRDPNFKVDAKHEVRAA